MTRPTREPALGGAAAGPRPAPGPEWLRVGGVALAVRDLARVEAFYREALGLGVVERTAETVRLGAGGVGFLELLHRPTALPDDPATAGLFHTAFLGVVQIRVTPKTRNPFTLKPLSISGVTRKWHFLNHAENPGQPGSGLSGTQHVFARPKGG